MKVSVIIALAIVIGVPLRASPPEEDLLACEPQIYFLLGMMAGYKAPGQWERFYPSESEVAKVYDDVAELLYVRLLQSHESAGLRSSWREQFVAFIDERFEKVSDAHDVYLVLDFDGLIRNARRSRSPDAFLAGAMLRSTRDSQIRLRSQKKAMAVAGLVNRRTGGGVIVHTYVGYTPGGSSVEFEETGVLRRVRNSWTAYTIAPPTGLVLPTQDRPVVAEFEVRIPTRMLEGNAAHEIGEAISFELDHREQGSVIESSYSLEEVEIGFTGFDTSGAVTTVREVLRSYSVPEDVTVRQVMPIVDSLSIEDKQKVQPGATDNPDDAQ